MKTTSALSPHLIEEIKALPARYPQPRSAVMPALDLAQEELGYLTPEAMTEVATALQLDAGYVEGVATFYTLFHLEPIGKHRFYMCTNLSCTLRGAEDLVERLKVAIDVHEAGDVSKDGLFSYEEVECLGACEYAPVCRLDHRYEVDLTAAKIDSLVNDRRLPRPYQKKVRPDSTAVQARVSPSRAAEQARVTPHPSPPPGGGGDAALPRKRAPRKKKADG
jgi:NADH-quinone oxidoreductase subunit E